MAFSKVSILLFAALTLLLASPSHARNHLLAGQRLSSGESLIEGSYNFIMQNDCNLVLYTGNTPIWASGTYGHGPGCYVVMQRDGNLVIYQGNTARWASNTNGRTGNYILVLQSDRNVVIYSQPIWATATNNRGTDGINIIGNGTAVISGAEQNKVSEMKMPTASIIDIVDA